MNALDRWLDAHLPEGGKRFLASVGVRLFLNGTLVGLNAALRTLRYVPAAAAQLGLPQLEARSYTWLSTITRYCGEIRILLANPHAAEAGSGSEWLFKDSDVSASQVVRDVELDGES